MNRLNTNIILTPSPQSEQAFAQEGRRTAQQLATPPGVRGGDPGDSFLWSGRFPPKWAPGGRHLDGGDRVSHTGGRGRFGSLSERGESQRGSHGKLCECVGDGRALLMDFSVLVVLEIWKILHVYWLHLNNWLIWNQFCQRYEFINKYMMYIGYCFDFSLEHAMQYSATTL